MLTYPKKYTDAEWKKAEKTIKIEATGLGKTLRDMEKTAKTLDQGYVALVARKTDAAKVKAALKAHQVTTKKAADQIDDTWRKQKDKTPAEKYLSDLRFSIWRYLDELKELKPDDRRGPEDGVERFNDRVASRT